MQRPWYQNRFFNSTAGRLRRYQKVCIVLKSILWYLLIQLGDRLAVTMKISEIIAKNDSYNHGEAEQLKVEVELFLNKKEASRAEIMSQRSDQLFSPDALEVFFRREERNEKISQILHYLLTFLIHVPESAECVDQMLDPIAQFRECVLYQVDLLLEADVMQAVFNQINLMGSLDGDNVWDYQERIGEKNRELNEMLVEGPCGTGSNLLTLCLVLEKLSLFWFDVKLEDFRHIRCSDIYIYKLVRILQGRCRPSP
jgi:hypothetical protein